MSFPGMKDKVAIVTGAGGGIGQGYAQALAAAGARVVVAEIDADRGEAAAAAICKSGGKAAFVHVDVGNEASTQTLAERTCALYGGIDFLVNNAAVFGTMKQDSLLDVDWGYYQSFMNVNLNGALLCTRACAPAMRARGGGAIVNQSSTAAWMGVGYYGLAKLAINGLTQCLARELGPQNIRVNAIAPGPTDTEALARQVPAEYTRQLVAQLPLSRFGTPDDLAGALLFLLSDAAAWITGHVLSVDGGQLFRP